MTYPRSKSEIVKVILAEIGDDPDNPWKDTAIDKLVFRWFATGRQGAGLRLTNEGEAAFEYAQIAFYTFPFPSIPLGWTSSTMKNINKKIQCPFYLGSTVERTKKIPYIKVYDHKIAMMITLYGTVGEYIETINE